MEQVFCCCVGQIFGDRSSHNDASNHVLTRTTNIECFCHKSTNRLFSEWTVPFRYCYNTTDWSLLYCFRLQKLEENIL
jgi:hypothetical protein